ncbi:MAG: carbohydrate-binding protein [Planctomycetota bacterium]|nr:carbohydrate-binding protein [Planctomycetota bacterium]
MLRGRSITGVVFSIGLVVGWLQSVVNGQTVALPQATVQAPYTWRNVRIVAGGFVPGIVFSSKQPGLIYARTDIGGAYRWDDKVKHWEPLQDWVGPADANLMGCESIAPDPIDAKKVYFAAGMYSTGKAAILRSSDAGTTCQIARVALSMGGNEDGRGMGERLSIDPSDTSVLYFGSRHDGLWLSRDSAVTWGKVSTFPFMGNSNRNAAGISFVLFDVRDGADGKPRDNIYVGVAEMGVANLFRSMDGGKSWVALPAPMDGMMPHHGAIDAVGSLYVTFSNGPGPNGVTRGAVWKLECDSGRWTDITPGGPPNARGGFGGLALDPRHPGTALVSTIDRWNTGDEIYRTIDGGANWSPVSPTAQRDASLSPYLIWGDARPKFGWWMAGVAIDPFDSNHALYGTGATIWGTGDLTQIDKGGGTHWTVAADGIEETAVLDLISPPVGAHLISGLGDIGGFKHDDLNIAPLGGMSSGPIFDNTSSLDFAERAPLMVLRAGTPHKRGEAGLALSVDGGTSWKPLLLAGSNGAAVAVSADGGSLVCGARSGGYVSKDHGVTWRPCDGFPQGARPVADRADAAMFYAINSSSMIIFVSRDGGASFKPIVSSGLPGQNGGRGMRLRAAPGRKGDLWLTSRGGLFHSSDGGVSFEKIAGVRSAVAVGFGKAGAGHEYPAIYFAGACDGLAAIFRSEDGGASWKRIDDEAHQFGALPETVIGDPRVFGRVYLGTNGRGIIYGEPVGN